MKINLDKRYYIENEMYGFVLRDGERATMNKNSKGVLITTHDIIGSYGTLPQATKGYLRILMNNNLTEVTMQEYIAEYQKQVDRITGLLPEKEKT